MELAVVLEALELFSTSPVVFPPTKKSSRLGYFPCPVKGSDGHCCPHSYLRKGDLKVHMMRLHSKEEREAFPQMMKPRGDVKNKPFVCPFPACADTRGYIRSRGLRRHLLKHHSTPDGQSFIVQKEKIEIV
jgi:hypothetical protein